MSLIAVNNTALRNDFFPRLAASAAGRFLSPRNQQAERAIKNFFGGSLAPQEIERLAVASAIHQRHALLDRKHPPIVAELPLELLSAADFLLENVYTQISPIENKRPDGIDAINPLSSFDRDFGGRCISIAVYTRLGRSKGRWDLLSSVQGESLELFVRRLVSINPALFLWSERSAV